MKTAINTFIIGAASIALCSCGGGSSDTASTSQTAQISVTTLAGTNGDMSKYLGTWGSDCGYNLIGTNQGKYQTNTFQFKSVSGGTITGTLTVRLYSDSQCRTLVSSAGPITDSAFSATYQGKVTVTTDSPVHVDGAADQLTLVVNGSSSSQLFTVGFYANYGKFLQGSSSFFNPASLSYAKL